MSGNAVQPLDPQPESTNQEGADEADVPQQKSCAELVVVWIVFVIFVTFRATDRVFYKRIGDALSCPAYNLMYTSVIWPLGIQILTFFLICGYVSLQRFAFGDKTYDCKFFLPGSTRASSMGAVPMYQLALFSIGDQLNAAISSPAVPFVAMAVQSVMSNMIVIYTALFAICWLRTRFLITHWLGMALVVVSVAVQFIPKLVSSNCDNITKSAVCGADKHPCTPFEAGECFISYKDATTGYVKLTMGAMMAWYVLFAMSFVPAGAGNVYKQKVLQMRDVDVWYATFWSGWWQVFWGWLCIPMMWIQLPGQEVVVPSTFFKDLGDTVSCLLGNMPRGPVLDANCHADSGGQPWVYVCFYFSFNLSFNVCLLFLTKRMSAAWAQVATVLCLNLCSFMSQFKFLMGNSAEPMTWSDWVGLVVASIALVVYNWVEEITPDLRPDDVKSEAADARLAGQEA